VQRSHLSIAPKLGKDSGKIHVYQPANDLLVAYEYTFDANKNKLTMTYNSNYPDKGKIQILNLWTKENILQKFSVKNNSILCNSRFFGHSHPNSLLGLSAILLAYIFASPE